MHQEFASKSEIQKWAESTFWGGYDSAVFSRKSQEAYILIGSDTGGIPSSEVFLFCKKDDGKYKLLLRRASMAGILKASETNEGIEIRTQKGNLILLIPWYGVTDEVDYFSK